LLAAGDANEKFRLALWVHRRKPRQPEIGSKANFPCFTPRLSSMLSSAVVGIVRFCTRFPWLIILAGICAAGVSAVYVAGHFAISTDINKLISPNLDWRQRELKLETEFPGHFNSTLVVVNAPSPELVSAATRELAQRLAAQPKLFHSVTDFSGSEFFARNAWLFQSTADVERLTTGLGRGAPVISALAGDPSLRGLTKAVSLALVGVQMQRITLDDLAPPLSMAADTLDDVLDGRAAVFSWLELLSGKPATLSELRRFIEVHSVLNYSALEPGRASSEAIRRAAADLDLAARDQARVRLTGPVPMGDQEFATVQHGALTNTIGTVAVVLIILWLALKSTRIISAVFINLFVGLSITAALGLLMVHALNMISVAFAVLFIGLGVDFAIQFSVRYRAERHNVPELPEALALAAQHVGVPLTLAAAAVTAGFFSFLPTDYRGVAELGLIAGVGMVIAYLTSITLLPALLTVFNPPGEPERVGYRALAPVDRFLQRYRFPVVGGTLAIALVGLPLLYHLSFDFDPIHLRSPDVESVATYLDLRGDPRTGINSIDLIMPTLDQAEAAAERLRKLPQVAQAVTLQSLVPADQPKKLEMIQALERKIGPLLRRPAAAAPSDEENIAALRATADRLGKAGAGATGAGAAAAKRLAANLLRLANASKAVRDKAQSAFIVPLQIDLAGLRDALQAQTVSKDTLPPDLARQWIAADGKARVEISPKGNTNDTNVLRSFARAVLAVYPNAIGGPISILKSGDTVVRAFIEAGIYALLSIAIILWLVLGRFSDMVLTLAPLLLAGVVTLEVSVLIGMPLNFANIIALPLLLGVGVAFKIYYIMAWRAGQTDLLQSSLTRAVIWSALTTATAFGSLWLSQHPGTSSMGKLMALSLVCTLAAAVLFQPALMGKPRQDD
jgi:hopanoid biosynthesis associated RND transporter like protein HpnN